MEFRQNQFRLHFYFSVPILKIKVQKTNSFVRIAIFRTASLMLNFFMKIFSDEMKKKEFRSKKIVLNKTNPTQTQNYSIYGF